MKIAKLISIILIITCLFASCSSKTKTVKDESNAPQAVDTYIVSDADIKHTRVTFEVQDYGYFVIETYPEYAPETVEHFLKLVKDGVYNGTTIETIAHSLYLLSSEGVLAPSSDSSASYIPTVVGEFADNGRSNPLVMDKYTVALNHIPGENDSAMSQFMIMLSSDHDMNGTYAVFGKVVEGTSIIDKIAGVEVNQNGTPVSPIVMKKAYVNE